MITVPITSGGPALLDFGFGSSFTGRRVLIDTSPRFSSAIYGGPQGHFAAFGASSGRPIPFLPANAGISPDDICRASINPTTGVLDPPTPGMPWSGSLDDYSLALSTRSTRSQVNVRTRWVWEAAALSGNWKGVVYLDEIGPAERAWIVSTFGVFIPQGGPVGTEKLVSQVVSDPIIDGLLGLRVVTSQSALITSGATVLATSSDGSHLIVKVTRGATTFVFVNAWVSQPDSQDTPHLRRCIRFIENMIGRRGRNG